MHKWDDFVCEMYVTADWELVLLPPPLLLLLRPLAYLLPLLLFLGTEDSLNNSES